MEEKGRNPNSEKVPGKTALSQTVCRPGALEDLQAGEWTIHVVRVTWPQQLSFRGTRGNREAMELFQNSRKCSLGPGFQPR